MQVREQVLLRNHTTFRIGGPAALFITVESQEELPKAFELARMRELDVYPLGQGSNVLAGDGPVNKAILTLSTDTITYTSMSEEVVEVYADAGVSWDTLVSEVGERGFWGLENLAGIPGTVGAAPVQNIGAYGVEVQDTILRVHTYDPDTSSFMTYERSECEFSYRDSVFKQKPGQCITGVTFVLSRIPNPKLMYPDIQKRAAEGSPLTTPIEIADVIQDIRSHKFPDLSRYGTAGSFFKNPVITTEHHALLKKKYPDLPGFAHAGGIKIPLAWVLDHVLHLRGFAHGPVSLFETQPLVMVAEEYATASDVDALATIVRERVYEATQIFIEREVQSLK